MKFYDYLNMKLTISYLGLPIITVILNIINFKKLLVKDI